MRGRPSDYDAWDEALRGENDDPGWGWKDVLPHFRGMEGNNRLQQRSARRRRAAAGLRRRLYRRHIALVRAGGAGAGRALQSRFQRAVAARRRLLSVHEPARKAQQRGLCVPRAAGARSEADDPAAIARAPHRHRERTRGRRRLPRRRRARTARSIADGEIVVASGALSTPQLLMLSGVGPAAHLREHGLDCLVDLPGVGANLIDHPEVPMAATTNGASAITSRPKAGACCAPACSSSCSARADPLGRRRGRRLRQPEGPLGRADDPGVLRAGDLRRPEVGRASARHLRRDDHDGASSSRDRAGPLRLASADPDAMPLVSPQLLADPADMAEMIEGQRFFFRVFQTSPMKERIERICMPIAGRPERRGARRALPALRQDQLSSERHVPHGPRRRSDGRA